MIKKILSCVIMAMAFVAFMGCGAGSSTPEAAAEKVLKNLLDGNVDEAIKLMRKKDGTEFDGEEKDALKNVKLAMYLAQYQDKGKVKSMKAKEAQYNKDKTKADVSIVIEYDSGKKSTDSFEVILVDGKWFVTI